MSIRVNIYKDQAAKDAEKSVDETKSYNVEGEQYNTAINAIKNRAINHDEDMVEAVYSLLLGFPFWEDWEIG